jgi:pimeloyl-ACP methyl ester carboxylesterase
MKKYTLGIGRTQKTLHVFEDQETDWVFKRTLEYMGEKAAEIGECLYAASRIDPRDGDSWIREWYDLGSRVEAQAEISLSSGNIQSSVESYLRACNYFRTAEYGCPPSHPRFQELWGRSVACMHKAAPLLSPPVQCINVLFEGKQLPGYFIQAGVHQETRPTMILVGGTDSTCEELLISAGFAAVRRGYNFFTFEYPGHRGAIHLYPDCIKRMDNTQAFKAAIDLLVSLPGVDERIAMVGLSWGGYVVIQVALSEPRIRALVPNCPIIDPEESVMKFWGPLLKRIPRPLFRPLLEWRLRYKPVVKAFMEYAYWSWGFPDLQILEYFNSGFLKDGNLRPLLPQITCPTLALVGAGEGETLIRQAQEFYQGISSPVKKLHIFNLEEDGSDDHCQLDNISRGTQVVYDWLEEVFETSKG